MYPGGEITGSCQAKTSPYAPPYLVYKGQSCTAQECCVMHVDKYLFHCLGTATTQRALADNTSAAASAFHPLSMQTSAIS